MNVLDLQMKLSKKEPDGYKTVGFIQKSDKFEALTCSLYADKLKELLENNTGKYIYLNVYVNSKK